jgi:hypothetical protein
VRVPYSFEKCLLLCLSDSFDFQLGIPFSGFSCMYLVARILDLAKGIHGTYHLSLLSQSSITSGLHLSLLLLLCLFSGLPLLLG